MDIGTEMPRGWNMLANLGMLGLLAGTALITVARGLTQARVPIRVRRR